MKQSRWIGVAFAVAAITMLAPAQEPAFPFKAMPTPPALPYYDWNACPFEGCAYRGWTARKPVLAYDTWKETRRVVAHLAPGGSVTAISGVVITSRPGVVRIEQDLPDLDLKRGDTILTYTYTGEASYSIWFKGRFYPSMIVPGADIDVGKKTWWAQVKLKSGKMAWVLAEDNFDGQDML